MGFLDKYNEKVVSEAADNYVKFPIGEIPTTIKNAVEKRFTSGRDGLEITFEDSHGAKIRGFIIDGDFAAKKLKNLQSSFNIPLGSQNLLSWIGKRGIVVTRPGRDEEYVGSNGFTYNRKDSAEISHYRSLKDAPVADVPVVHNEGYTESDIPF
ncbi:hypothetical protein FACS1894200_12780 [Spirochaetia bacterium]|nr:hypothetical protein FACS1894200_12780 [Spirochaetia bacterium]